MAKHGMTNGIKNALSKGCVHSMCKDCGFPLPRYPGRYPKSCPSCGEERHPETPHESVEASFEDWDNAEDRTPPPQ